MPRPFRHPIRPRRPARAGRRPAVERALVRLRRAHQRMEAGDYLAAARMFSDLADAADRQQLPRGAQLHLQAARAWLKHGDNQQALKRLHHGVDLLERTGQHKRLAALGPRLVAEMRDAGLDVEADELQARLDGLESSPHPAFARSQTTSQQPFPTKCGNCGGVIHPDEIEWIDEDHAVCSYCGSILERELSSF